MTEEVDKDSLSFILTLSLQNKQIKLKKKNYSWHAKTNLLTGQNTFLDV